MRRVDDQPVRSAEVDDVRWSRRQDARRWLRHVLVAAIAVVLLVDVTTLVRPGPVRAYLTHWKRSPTNTEPYGPYPVAGGPLVRIAVAGDIGDSGTRLDRTADGVRALGADRAWDALLLLGDNVYPDGDPAGLPETVFEPFGPVLADGTTLLAILGNHDVKEGNGPRQVAALGMDGRWWARRLGPVLVVGLDSTMTDDPGQLAWLERTLAASTAPWKIVAVHHPPYSAGYQGSALDVRATFSPAFERHGVQLVLSGHDHDYQRTAPIRGVTYVVSGAAAGTRRTSSRSFTAQSFSWHHFLEVAVFADELVVRAVNQELRVADEVIVGRK